MKSQSKVVFEKICSENQAEILAWLSRLKLITALKQVKHYSVHAQTKIRGFQYSSEIENKKENRSKNFHKFYYFYH